MAAHFPRPPSSDSLNGNPTLDRSETWDTDDGHYRVTAKPSWTRPFSSVRGIVLPGITSCTGVIGRRNVSGLGCCEKVTFWYPRQLPCSSYPEGCTEAGTYWDADSGGAATLLPPPHSLIVSRYASLRSCFVWPNKTCAVVGLFQIDLLGGHTIAVALHYEPNYEHHKGTEPTTADTTPATIIPLIRYLKVEIRVGPWRFALATLAVFVMTWCLSLLATQFWW